MFKLYTVLHPIEADNPWKAPEGWRWAIQTDDQWAVPNIHYEIPGSGANSITAGWESSRESAEGTLSLVLISCRRALLAAGVESEVHATTLNDCPLNEDVLGVLAVLG